ncbi:DUF2283 domain-containing protein [Actinomadura scrupuli]|uniref:DUF2283 domain-containing protein n=1 Tax=Actinomadura scrupuli TaxID=559629 RepID=UPI003D96C70A
MYIEAHISLVCTYDSDADAAYIYLDPPIPPAAVERTVTFDVERGMFNLDLNSDGHVLGLEIISARERLPPVLLRALLDHEGDTKDTQ